MQQSTIEMWTIAISGIVTVFVCLIALVAMVSIFKLIFVGKEKKAADSSDDNGTGRAPASRGIDPAVVAVIVAAIAASSGVAASSIRIASIERSGFNTPVWGYVDRVNQGTTFGRA